MAKLAKELLPALDNLDRALDGRGPGRPAARGRAPRALGAERARSRASGIESFVARRRARSTRPSTRRWPQQPVGGRRERHASSRSTSPATGWARASSARRACSSPRSRGGRRWHRVPTTTRRSGSTRRRPPRRSRRPTASSRASTTPTATPTTSRPRRASRRSPRPTTCSATPRSASSTTAARGRSPPAAGPGGGFGGFGNFDFDASSMGDILSNLFGGGPAGGRRARQRQRARAERGADLEAQVSISFDQAIAGAQVPLSVPMRATCATCHGTGAKPGTTPTVCPRCEGRGIETQGQGMFSISQPCSRCGGSGTVIEDPCPTCHGAGAVRTVKRLRVNIPAGVRDGSRIRLRRQGRARPRRRPARRPLPDHARRALAGVHAQGRQPRGRGAAEHPRGAARRRGAGADAERHEDAARARRAPRTAPSSACAARGRRSSGQRDRRRRAATSTTAS